MRSTPLSRLLAVLALLPLLGACSSTGEPDPRWQAVELEAPSDRFLWNIGVRACDKLDFPVPASLDRSTMIIETGWKNSLAPFSRQGTREKAELRFAPQERGVWTLEARVKRQRNMSIVNPLDERYADWEWTEDNVALAQLLVQHVRSFLSPEIDPVDRPDDEVDAYLRRHGLDGDS